MTLQALSLKNGLIDWAKVDTVLLDMDGTLLDLHFDNYFWQSHLPNHYAQKHKVDVLQAKALLEPRMAREEGTLNWYCLDFWSRELGVDIITLKREVSHLIRPHTYALRFLRALRAAKKDVWLVTNAHSDSVNLKLEHTPLASWLNRIVTSHTMGFPKEKAEFWSALQVAHPFEKMRALMVDDNISVLRAARTYGIAQLLCIVKPSSAAPAIPVTEFQNLHGFDELLAHDA